MTPKKFYFAGHTHFGNRGCEALIRSTVALLKNELGPIEALVPSSNAELDASQWPSHAVEGVRFVPAPQLTQSVRWWNRGVRLVPAAKSYWLPDSTPKQAAREPIDDCDAIIMTGGDVISLDYGLASLVWNLRLVEPWVNKGKPTFLWGASVGPFSSEPAIERYAAGILGKLTGITVRESISMEYLERIGVRKNVTQVTDPAFNLIPEATELSFFPRQRGRGLLGLNVSPLIQRFRPAQEPISVLRGELVEFIKTAIRDHDLSVLLVPHVGPLGGGEFNSDYHYMKPMLEQLSDHGDRISMTPDNFNAAQLKFIIGQVDLFIGARTHATIAAMSSSVPTLSIAYSVKAKGLNRDLFGDERFVIETPRVSATSLTEKLKFLLSEQTTAKALLTERIPVWRKRGQIPAVEICRAMSAHSGILATEC